MNILNINKDICIYRYTAFLTHVDTQQLLRQMLAYIEEKHYHVGKKFSHVGFVWHPDALFQPNDISVLSTFISKTIYMK